MEIICSAKKQLRQERQKNAALQAELEKTKATLEYVAMMADVELPESEEVTGNGENG
jgi:hypothetical protein